MKKDYDFMAAYKLDAAVNKRSRHANIRRAAVIFAVFCLIIPAAAYIGMYWHQSFWEIRRDEVKAELRSPQLAQEYSSYLQNQGSYQLVKVYNDNIETAKTNIKSENIFSRTIYEKVRALENQNIYFESFGASAGDYSFAYYALEISAIPKFVSSVYKIDDFSEISYSGWTRELISGEGEADRYRYSFDIVCRTGSETLNSETSSTEDAAEENTSDELSKLAEELEHGN